MARPLLRTDKEVAELYERHLTTVYRVCFAYMKNTADTEDVVQDVFVKLIMGKTAFENTEHEKAWLIRVATNLCKDKLRHWWRKRKSLEDSAYVESEQSVGVDETLGAIMDLPEKYKSVVYLYYYEGYSSVEISKALQKPQSTIRNYLHEARKLLRERLAGGFQNEG